MSRRTPRRSELVTPRSGPVTRPGGRSPPIDQRRNEVMYRLLGAVHANAVALRDRRGQGTVEYVALILLVYGAKRGDGSPSIVRPRGSAPVQMALSRAQRGDQAI